MNYLLFSRPARNSIRVILLLAILFLSFGASGTDTAYAAPPVHDDFDAAKTIDSIIYRDHNVNTTEATPTVDEDVPDDPTNFPCDGTPHLGGFATVWYTYTPPEAQSLSLDTFGTNYDTFIAVWTGTRTNLNLVACNDETSEGFSELSFVANAGTQYYIEIAQFNDGLDGTTIFGGTLFFNAYITNTNIEIGGVLRGRYFVPPSDDVRRSFINLNDGPVEIFNVSGNPLIAAERVIYYLNGLPTSFSEIMGLPHEQLDTSYWFPWYNNVHFDTQLRIGNVGSSSASGQIFIHGGAPRGSFNLGPGESIRVSFRGVNDGPVEIRSNNPIVAAERVIYKVNGVDVSFTEMMGLPTLALDNVYWFPWYNNVDLDTQLRMGNVSNSLTANVQIFVAGIPRTGTFQLGPGASERVSFAGLNNGPVQIVSDIPIVAAERIIYRVNNVPLSFSEMMGLPASQLDTTYWMPAYNNRSLDTQLRFGNVSGSPASVQIFIGGTPMGTFPIGVGGSARKSFPNVNDGPVQVVSNVPIVAAQRVILRNGAQPTGFSEMMGMPNDLLSARYWMPWYNNFNLDTQLRFSLP
jgi:hypothetical protein